jgi:O-antigen/teichoic acid export membrane protein
VSQARIIYVALFALAAFFGFAKTLIYARILFPVDFGVFSLAVLVTTFCSYLATAGTLEGLACQVPILLGQGRDTTSIRSNALSILVLMTFSVGLLIFFGCLIAVSQKPSLAALMWLPIFFISTVLLAGLLVDLQVRELSIQYVAVLCLKSVLAPLIALLIAPSLGASGVLIAETVSLLACIVLCLFVWGRDLRLLISFNAKIKTLASLGFPFTVSNLLQNLSVNIDRWAVQLVFGVATLGTYAFALNFSAIGLMVLSMIQLYAAPRMLRVFGVSNDMVVVFGQAKRLLIGVFFVFAVGAIPAFLLFPILIEQWFPQYLDAIDLMIPVYIGTSISALGFFDILFRATGNGRKLVAIQSVISLFGCLACFFAFYSDSPIVTYAIIFASTRLLSFGLGWFLAMRYVDIHVQKAKRMQ